MKMEVATSAMTAYEIASCPIAVGWLYLDDGASAESVRGWRSLYMGEAVRLEMRRRLAVLRRPGVSAHADAHLKALLDYLDAIDAIEPISGESAPEPPADAEAFKEQS
jgi:hypothetical protein